MERHRDLLKAQVVSRADALLPKLWLGGSDCEDEVKSDGYDD